MTVFYNSKTRSLEAEATFGGLGLKLLYGNPIGFWLTDHWLSKKWLSRLSGFYFSSPLSRLQIPSFVRRYGIRLEDFEDREFKSFNDFFQDALGPVSAVFPEERGQMGAPAEGRYLGWSGVDEAITFPVKGMHFNANAVLGPVGLDREFMGGPLLICRLCPVDYHRFHFPDRGRWKSSPRIPGQLHSVNPAVFGRKPEVFSVNERVVSLLETENFGKLAYVEVGALNVGAIVQTRKPGDLFERGDEKGTFLFGGSTLMIFGQPGKWTVDPLIEQNTREQVETWLELGAPVAES